MDNNIGKSKNDNLYVIYNSVEDIKNDNNLKDWEKLLLIQLLENIRFIKRFSKENVKEFFYIVQSKSNYRKYKLFEKIGLYKKRIIKRKEHSVDEYKPLLLEISDKLGEVNGLSFANFIENYGIRPAFFQISAWKSILFSNKKMTVITAPTGFGKTEAFLLPIVYKVFIEAMNNKISHALFIYPRRILIEDQASRILKAIACISGRTNSNIPKIIIGLQKAEIPSDFNEKKLVEKGILKKENDKYYLSDVIQCKLEHNDGKPGRLVLSSEKYETKDGKKLKIIFECEKCRQKYYISLCRNYHKALLKEIDVSFFLITTFESLERLMIQDEFQNFFKKVFFLVIDEAHVYSYIYGLHISCIIRKLFNILNELGNSYLKIIVSSATLPHPKEFVLKLFSSIIKEEDIDIIEVKEDDIEYSDNYKYFILLLTNSEEEIVKKASAFIQTVMYCSHVLNRLYDSKDFLTKCLCFFDSRDSIYRIKKQLEDAEKRKLFMYRFSSLLSDEILRDRLPEEHDWEKLFKIKKVSVSSKYKDSLTKEISYITSEIKEEIKLINLATSAMELGIDDPSINVIIQYGAPESILSFVQRIGRGNRFNGDRFFITILEKTDPIDTFFFSNNSLLTEEALEKEGVFIPETNQIVLRIHKLLEELSKAYLKKIKAFQNKK